MPDEKQPKPQADPKGPVRKPKPILPEPSTPAQVTKSRGSDKPTPPKGGDVKKGG